MIAGQSGKEHSLPSPPAPSLSASLRALPRRDEFTGAVLMFMCVYSYSSALFFSFEARATCCPDRICEDQIIFAGRFSVDG